MLFNGPSEAWVSWPSGTLAVQFLETVPCVSIAAERRLLLLNCFCLLRAGLWDSLQKAFLNCTISNCLRGSKLCISCPSVRNVSENRNSSNFILWDHTSFLGRWGVNMPKSAINLEKKKKSLHQCCSMLLPFIIILTLNNEYVWPEILSSFSQKFYSLTLSSSVFLTPPYLLSLIIACVIFYHFNDFVAIYSMLESIPYVGFSLIPFFFCSSLWESFKMFSTSFV